MIDKYIHPTHQKAVESGLFWRISKWHSGSALFIWRSPSCTGHTNLQVQTYKSHQHHDNLMEISSHSYDCSVGFCSFLLYFILLHTLHMYREGKDQHWTLHRSMRQCRVNSWQWSMCACGMALCVVMCGAVRKVTVWIPARPCFCSKTFLAKKLPAPFRWAAFVFSLCHWAAFMSL